MAGVIDTNILLYAANKDAEEHAKSASFLREAAGSSRIWFLTEGILHEFLRVSTHSKVFERPLTWKDALHFVKPFLLSPQFQILIAGEDHWVMLERIL